MLAIIFYFGIVLVCQAAITKYHRLNGLNNKNLSSHSSGGWNSKIKVPAWLVSPKTCLLGLQMITLLPPLHRVFPLCTYDPGASLHVQISSSNKDTG